MAAVVRGSNAYVKASITRLLGETDNEVGAKFARLPARDSDAVIRTIQAEGQAAGRKRILELDKSRRVVRTRRDRATRYAGLGPDVRRERWGDYAPGSDGEFWAIYKSAVKG